MYKIVDATIGSNKVFYKPLKSLLVHLDLVYCMSHNHAT